MIFQLGPYTAEIAKPSVEVERPSFDKKKHVNLGASRQSAEILPVSSVLARLSSSPSHACSLHSLWWLTGAHLH